MDVGAWLKSLGLGQYESTFRDNAIDGDVLPSLTAEDLREVGVAAVGHRRRLLDAIDALRAAPAPPASPPQKFADLAAERRTVTVLFCDLVGSTALAAELDAEDWRDLVGDYIDAAAEAVTRYGGHVLKRLGDGLMALFGYPCAQENDAERAARAALAILAGLEDLNAKNATRNLPKLAARVGLDMGPVVIDAVGEVFGDAPNVAARVQRVAEPGCALVTAAVQRETAGLFVAEDRGRLDLGGALRSVALYRLVRASGAGRRGGVRALTPFVGREGSLDLLMDRFGRACAGEGQFVQIVGEPGIGKSRLIDEFHARLGETPHTWAEWASSQLLQNTPLHPFAEWGRMRFGGPEVAPDARLGDLERTLRLVKLDPDAHAPLLAPLLDIPLPEARLLKLAPEELRRRQLGALVDWIFSSARSQPVVLAFEDLHWADPTTLDLMATLADRGATAPLLIVATARSGFRPPWATRPHHSVMSLAPLDHAEIRCMIDAIAERRALPRDVVERVTDRTGGVPLFVEEVTRLLLEDGAGAIPPTLQQSLAARLDRLGEAREVAQIGAVLGREFPYGLLRAVAAGHGPSKDGGLSERFLDRHGGLNEIALQSALGRLAEADLVFVEGHGPDATYRFKHALIQDAAYESLLKSRRQALHRRAAEALLVAADPPPELVARHFTGAGETEEAIDWWGRAGDAALRRSAFQEAIAHLGKAIEMADKLPAGTRDRSALRVAYGNALIAARGHGALETSQVFARVRDSHACSASSPERLAAHYGVWVGSYARGELAAMRTHVAAFLADVSANPRSPEAGVAHRVAGTTGWFAGEFAQARDHLERALALFEPGRDDDLAFRFGQDVGVAASVYLALTAWPMGDVARATDLVAFAERRIAAIEHVNTLAYGKCHLAFFALMSGDAERARSLAREVSRLARAYNLSMWRAFAAMTEAVFDDGRGRNDIGAAAELLRAQNTPLFDGLFKGAQARSEASERKWDDALATVGTALATSDRAGHRAFDAELHRLRGDILLQRDPGATAVAEEAYRTSIAVAKGQGARTYHLLAAIELARLRRSAGDGAEGHAVLGEALDGFTPTPELPAFAEAQALVAALA